MRREEIERLYEQQAPALVAYAAALLGRRTAAEDVVQQIFLKLLRGADIFPSDPRAYMYRAVRNAALNARRAGAREVELRPDAPWFSAPMEAPHNALAVQSALLDLPEEQREVIVMRVWGDLTLEQVATVLDISANTAASRYRYGLQKLRRRLRPVEVKEHAARK